MTTMNVNVDLVPGVSEKYMPTFKTAGAAGADVRARVDVDLLEGEMSLVPLGFRIEVPEGYVAKLYPRSGLSTKMGLTLINSVGLVDSDFRGEVLAPVFKATPGRSVLKAGAHIAQMVIEPVPPVTYVQSSELSETDRGEGGFGSTGVW